MRVAMPPIEALYAIASISALPNTSCSSVVFVAGSSLNCATMAMPIGSIITEVAVFEIHIDKKAVAIMNPKIMLLTLVPISLMVFSAIRRCKFHFSIAIAIIKPPMYRNTYLCPKEAVVDARSSPPVSGNRIIGSKAVTAMGKASVIHQIAIHKVEARMAFASWDRSSGRKAVNTKINTSGPDISPICFDVRFIDQTIDNTCNAVLE